MKAIATLLLFSFCLTIQAQKLTVEETNLQVSKGDSLYKSGKNLLVEFVLMQDSAMHTHALVDLNKAKVIYENVMENGMLANDDWGQVTATLVSVKISSIKTYNSLYGRSFQAEIMAETEKERTKKVKYKGAEYKLSKDSKTHFENLNV